MTGGQATADLSRPAAVVTGAQPAGSARPSQAVLREKGEVPVMTLHEPGARPAGEQFRLQELLVAETGTGRPASRPFRRQHSGCAA
jgi:hypothetical protein